MQSADLCPFIQFPLRWPGLYYTLQHPPASSSSPSLPEIALILESTFAIIYSSPFGNDITQIQEAGKYCRSFIIPDVPWLVISEQPAGQWDYFISLPLSLYLFPHPTGIRVQMGHFGRGFAWPRSLEGQAFHHLLMQSFPPQPLQPQGSGHPSSHTPLCCPRGADGEGKCSSLNGKTLPHMETRIWFVCS